MKRPNLAVVAGQVRDALGLLRLLPLEVSAHPDRPDKWQSTVMELQRRIEDGVSSLLWAAHALREAEEQTVKAEDKAQARVARYLNTVKASSLADALMSPHGFFVYILVSRTGEPLYVGRSGNVLARLGQHMTDPKKRSQVEHIALIRCDTEEAMAATEHRLIVELLPPWNTLGIPAGAR